MISACFFVGVTIGIGFAMVREDTETARKRPDTVFVSQRWSKRHAVA